MSELRWIPVLALLVGVMGCCSTFTTSDCAPAPARLVDVNTERGNEWGRNFYTYRTHELHPDHVRRYDYHPEFHHRYVHDEESW